MFHYVPLHTSSYGRKHGSFIGKDNYTTAESERLLRLPMFYSLSNEEVEYVTDTIKRFYRGKIL